MIIHFSPFDGEKKHAMETKLKGLTQKTKEEGFANFCLHQTTLKQCNIGQND